MNFADLVQQANLRLSELGLDRLPDGRVADHLAPRNVRFLRQAGVISKPEGRGSAARWSEIHLQQIITGRAMQAIGLSINEIRDRINGLDLKHLKELENKALDAWSSEPAPTTPEISSCSSWQLTPDFILVSTRKGSIPKDKLEQISLILNNL